MVTIGIDPHKDTHHAVAADSLGKQLADREVSADVNGFGALLAWGRSITAADDRVWVIEDCRHVSGPLERFLIDHGEAVARLAPHLMSVARTHVRERGKSDPIDALAVARAAIAQGLENLPTARLAGPELEIRLLHQHHQRLVKQRTALINDLRWNLHDLFPGFAIPARRLSENSQQAKVARKLAKAAACSRVRVARDELRRIRELTRSIQQLITDLDKLTREIAPQLVAETGIGPITAAAVIGEVAGIDRFTSDSQLARIAGCAPIPVASGRMDRHRLDRGGNRQLNYAVHMIALSRLRHDPETAIYIAKQRERGKTKREAIRCLKRHIIRRIFRLLTDPTQIQRTICLT
jgi:transposase